MGSTLQYLPDTLSDEEMELDVAVVVGLNADTTNEVLNPSAELNTTYWGAIGGSALARTTDYQRRGAWSVRVTPTAGATDGAYTTFYSGGAYTYSVSIDYLIPDGEEYQFYVSDNAGVPVTGALGIVGNGHWQRVSMAYTDTVAAERRICVSKNNHASTNAICLDGALAARSGYELTYWDGDSVGLLATRKDFYWNGTPHGSSSMMKAQTRGSGRIVHLYTLGFFVQSVVGLGMGTYRLVSTQLAQVGGEQYQQALAQGRVFDLVGTIAANSRTEFMRKRDDIESYLAPHGAPRDQPLVLLLKFLNTDGDLVSDTLKIVCQNAGGLTGNFTGCYDEKVSARFKVFDPFLQRDGSGGGDAMDTLALSAGNANYVIAFREGIWDTLAAGVDASISCVAIGPDGNYYVGGSFSNSISGVAMSRIGMYNPTTGIWSALGAGLDDVVLGIVFDAAGNLLAVGDFLNSGANPVTRVGLWDGAAWNDVGGGVDNRAYSIAVDHSGNYIVGGIFLNAAAGAVPARRLAIWSGAAWAEFGGGADARVWKVFVNSAGNTIVGGDFTEVGGVTVSAIAEWNGTAWNAMNGGVDNPLPTSPSVYDITENPAGDIFAVGVFGTAGNPSITVNNIARWDGYTWYALSAGVETTPTGVVIDAKNGVWVSGPLTTAGGLALPAGIGRWNGSSWVYAGVIPAAGSTGTTKVAARNDTILMTAFQAATQIRTEAITSIASAGENKPRFVIDHSAGTVNAQVYQIINYTTEDNLFFNLELMPGERLAIDTERATITSTFRGNLMSTLLPGSNLSTFHLAPGVNRIGVFILTTGMALPIPTAVIYWDDHLESLSKVVY